MNGFLFVFMLKSDTSIYYAVNKCEIFELKFIPIWNFKKRTLSL
ncbi:hypothetical protein SAMN05444364_10427 [Prevotella scopos JCM 17725]|uniref:Uncharacterized protein n=1 Tax=Prevotella scopos JCM 17725 TaxID=1236518 RepID=A0AAX2F1U1_9BACT|nr:hypothetical protein SAMN05444364_10427 [Prevotella scopos JCM 17725]